MCSERDVRLVGLRLIRTRSEVIAKYQTSMIREKLRFFLGLGLLLLLFYVSVSRQQQPMGYEYAVLLSLALAILVFEYLKVSKFLTVVKECEDAQRPHDLAIEAALTATLKSPLLVRLLRNEVLTLYYAFFASFERSGVVVKHSPFGYAKSSNAHDVFLFVALSQLPFLPLIHAVLEYKKGPAPAWTITLLTLWSVVWYLAQVEAVKFRPIELSNDYLRYRFGLLWTADIPLEKIRSARSVDVAETFDGKDLFVSPMGSAKNVILEFEAPIRFSGPYALRRHESKAAISLDDPADFLRQLALRGVATR